ncbi:MAG: molybdenum cofactor biosynthesis protein MoaD [Chloroflexi bacterium]|jgi:sulfur-carrier protein|nr:molybdenum cofactor biosynthesis protein MoaD [Chloroflexota bacterium]MBT3670424.1 molybdenum cofactor biosynthesis protein MoaD [Chloroflexota bacterium]MBT4003741.1 molybdenum cofactor biosynthesis protein MoaD [Chloroflexota bacterium]MBT4304674.1 molybdenum cofactor biosynthesis protein MoaD [Chloroflexota bacterium]MBT4532570.1 molybdenum cofactor biosynthesis protein MoaD [Chloroflexota bacterium]
MPEIKFTNHLKRFFPALTNGPISGHTIAEVVAALDVAYPGLSAYIVDEHGKLRQHVNIFVGEDMIEDREGLSDKVNEDERMYIFQALSGG